MLFIYAPSPSIDPKYTYHLKYADRYYAHFPKMSEFAFLNFGIFDQFIPNIIGEQKGPTSNGFVAACKIVLRFFDIQLKEQQGALFDSVFLHETEDLIDTTFIRNGFPILPSVTTLKNMFLQKGFGPIDSTYQAQKRLGNSQPFSLSFFSAFRDWLAWQKDPSFEARRQLYSLGLESYPNSAAAHYYLAYYLEKTGKVERAIELYQETVEMIEGRKDIKLAVDESQQLLKWANQGIQELDDI